MAENNFGEALLSNVREFLDSSPDCVLVCDYQTHQYLYINQTTCTMTGYSRKELLSLEASQLTGQSRRQIRRLHRLAKVSAGAGYVDEPRLMASKEQDRRGWWESHFRYKVVQGRELVLIVSREVTRRVLAEHAAIRAKKIYAALSATNEAIIRSSSPDELFKSVCDAAIASGGMTTAAVLMPRPGSGLLETRAMAGFGREAMVEMVISTAPDCPEGQGLNGRAFRSGKPQVTEDFLKDPRTRHWHDLVRSRTRVKSAAAVPILRAGSAIGTLYLCSRERRAFDEEIIGLLVRMADNLSYALQTFEREEERRQAEERAHYLATHCSLTGLPNRNLLAELLEQTIASVDRTGHKPAIMFIDLDHFKKINDTWGHDIGDRVLEQVASRLRGVLRSHDVLARLGGDEFVVLAQNIERQAHAVRVAEKLLQAAREPLEIGNRSFRVSFSIGISLYPDHGLHQQDLMKAADLAMYVAKENGKNTWSVFGQPAGQSVAAGLAEFR
ncbi:MAG: diguanylate cyclase domain-containing protein [Marinobacter sp.]